MARYITADLGTGIANLEMYALIFKTDIQGQIWNHAGQAWTTYNEGNYAVYGIPAAEIGSTGVCQFALPALVDVPGSCYSVSVRKKVSAGSTASPGDMTNMQFEYRVPAVADLAPSGNTFVV